MFSFLEGGDKMKRFKRFGMILTAFLVAFFNIGYTKAASIVNEGNILDDNNQPFFVAKDSTLVGKYVWAKLKTSDNNVAYCLDYGYNWPDSSTGVPYKDDFDAADAGIIYILEHGAADYNNPTNRERYITQGAIWLYTTGSNTFTPEFTDTYGLLQEMNSLVSQANNAKRTGGIVNGTIGDISTESKHMTISGKYHISSPITPNISGATEYSVSVSGGSESGPIDDIEILSTDGNAKTTFSAGESFVIRMPRVGGPAGVVVSVSINTKAHVISPAGNNGYQRVITLSSTDKTITKSISLDLAPVCVDYKIVGDVIPDVNLTDPTPGKSCVENGTNYSQEAKLTTRTNCTFKGWFTKDDLTGTWTDGTVLTSDMTLYGAWECPETVSVPPTAASTPLIILGTGLTLVAAGFGFYIFKHKKA